MSLGVKTLRWALVFASLLTLHTWAAGWSGVCVISAKNPNTPRHVGDVIETQSFGPYGDVYTCKKALSHHCSTRAAAIQAAYENLEGLEHYIVLSSWTCVKSGYQTPSVQPAIKLDQLLRHTQESFHKLNFWHKAQILSILAALGLGIGAAATLTTPAGALALSPSALSAAASAIALILIAAGVLSPLELDGADSAPQASLEASPPEDLSASGLEDLFDGADLEAQLAQAIEDLSAAHILNEPPLQVPPGPSDTHPQPRP